MKISRRFYRPVHVAVLTSVMVLMVTLVATLANRGPADGFVFAWLKTWLMSWPIAWTTALLWGGHRQQDHAPVRRRTALMSVHVNAHPLTPALSQGERVGMAVIRYRDSPEDR